MEGKMDEGKLDPANPHFTNPVPLSQTIVVAIFPSSFVYFVVGRGGENETVGGRKEERREKRKWTERESATMEQTQRERWER